MMISRPKQMLNFLKIGKALRSTTKWEWKGGCSGPDPKLDLPTKFYANGSKLPKFVIEVVSGWVGWVIGEG